MGVFAAFSTTWARTATLGVAMVVPYFAGHFRSDIRLGVSFQGEVPGLRFRSDADSLFQRSATVFESRLGMNTGEVLGDTGEYLEERFGVEASCAPIPVVDVFRSNFLTGDIRLTDGAWALYTDADLAGGPCPTTTLEPRQPSYYLETIRQRGDYRVDLEFGGFALPIEPDVELIQVLVLPAKPGLVVGGTFAAEHGAYTLNAISPADLTVPFDDMIFGYMRVDFGRGVREIIHFESLEPDTTSPSGYKAQTLLLESPTFGTGIYSADYAAMAVSWAPDPELTGNAVLGIPRNPILTPRRVNFRYQGRANFPYVPAHGAHSVCVSDFSDPANLKICPNDVP